MKKLTPEQIKKLRKPFDDVGAFKGRSDEEVEKLLNEMMDIWTTLGNINLRLHKEEAEKRHEGSGDTPSKLP